MAFTYEAVEPSFIPNTTIIKSINNGVHLAYRITPIDGYVLHDKTLDVYSSYDNEGNPLGEPLRGYVPQTCGCGASYDFTVTTTIDGYTAYGEREFFARPASEVPENQIFGDVEPDHEVM